MKNVQDLNISADFADSLYTVNPQNWRKFEKLVLLTVKNMDYFLPGLRIFNLQNQQKIGSGQLFANR